MKSTEQNLLVMYSSPHSVHTPSLVYLTYILILSFLLCLCLAKYLKFRFSHQNLVRISPFSRVYVYFSFVPFEQTAEAKFLFAATQQDAPWSQEYRHHDKLNMFGQTNTQPHCTSIPKPYKPSKTTQYRPTMEQVWVDSVCAMNAYAEVDIQLHSL